jgi:hypothetical protein
MSEHQEHNNRQGGKGALGGRPRGRGLWAAVHARDAYGGKAQDFKGTIKKLSVT